MTKKVTIDAWVARDKVGTLFISKSQPERQVDDTWDSWDMDWVALSENSFPNIGMTWEDEPKKCQITIEITSKDEE